MTGTKGLKVMVNLSTCIAEAFDAADACLISCLQSLDTPGEEFDSTLKSIAISRTFKIPTGSPWVLSGINSSKCQPRELISDLNNVSSLYAEMIIAYIPVLARSCEEPLGRPSTH